jgi:hypothetical protein
LVESLATVSLNLRRGEDPPGSAVVSLKTIPFILSLSLSLPLSFAFSFSVYILRSLLWSAFVKFSQSST